MSRLDFKTQDRAERTVEGLYRDLEQRIIASSPGLCPVDLASAFLKLCHAQTCGKCAPLSEQAHRLFYTDYNNRDEK